MTDPKKYGKINGKYSLCLKEFKIAASTTMIYILSCCAICWFLGYNKTLDEISYIGGIPSWVVLGIIVPWLVMVAFTVIYGFYIMKGDDK